MFWSNILTVIRYKNTDTEGKVLQTRASLQNKSAKNREDIIPKTGKNKKGTTKP
jgi:hypothetical protein